MSPDVAGCSTCQGCRGATQQLSALNAAMKESHTRPALTPVSSFAQKLGAEATTAGQASSEAAASAGAAAFKNLPCGACQVGPAVVALADHVTLNMSTADAVDTTSGSDAAGLADNGGQHSATGAHTSVSCLANGQSVLGLFWPFPLLSYLSCSFHNSWCGGHITAATCTCSLAGIPLCAGFLPTEGIFIIVVYVALCDLCGFRSQLSFQAVLQGIACHDQLAMK